MFSKKSKPILVLNLANPVNPGGGVRRGSKAQEEDLCRKSSLLLSLESSAAHVITDTITLSSSKLPFSSLIISTWGVTITASDPM